MRAVDVAVIGAGPAGSVAAFRLARAGLKVMLVEAGAAPTARIGETLQPQALDLLAALGLLDAVEHAGVPSYGVRSAWGAAEPTVHSHVTHPRGAGMHLDRGAFDGALAAAAAQAGARLVRSARLTGAEPTADGWLLAISGAGTGLGRAAARFVIDASGRRAAFARLAGARRGRTDPLTALAFHGFSAPLSDYGAYALIETTPRGWWYSAPLPGGRAVAVLFSRPSELRSLDPVAAVTEAHLTAARHQQLPLGPARRHAAGASLLQPLHGCRWLAAGDAAMTFDPMSGDGLYRALQSAAAGADAAAAALAGDTSAAALYAQVVRTRFHEWSRRRADYYRAERRWPQAGFWRWAHALDAPAHGMDVTAPAYRLDSTNVLPSGSLNLAKVPQGCF